MKRWILLAMFLGMSLAAPQKEEGELTEEEIKELTTKGDTPLEVALRCGLFFAGEVGAPPIERLFVFNATWEAPECPSKEPVSRWTDFCATIWERVSKGLRYERLSINKEKAAKGIRIGDDICSVLLKDYKVPFVGRKQNSRRYPDGLEIGMYANGCGNVDWQDTGLRHTERVCCLKGVYDAC